MQTQVTAERADATSADSVEPSRPVEPPRPVTALSSLIMTVGRDEMSELAEEFAARAGVSPELVEAIGNGKRPAWAIDGPEVFKVADAMREETAGLFLTAANCDLMIENVLRGDTATASAAAAEVLNDPKRREAARSLLTMAVQAGTGTAPSPWHTWSAKEPLLDAEDRELLRARATEIAGSGTPDAWLGDEILGAFTVPVDPYPDPEFSGNYPDFTEAEQEAEIEL